MAKGLTSKVARFVFRGVLANVEGRFGQHMSGVGRRVLASVLVIPTLAVAVEGEVLWAKQFGGAVGRAAGVGNSIDVGEKVYKGGGFSGTVDFDMGAACAYVIVATDVDAETTQTASARAAGILAHAITLVDPVLNTP